LCPLPECDANRGGDPDRLERATRCAAELGLEVWFSPSPLELTPGGIVALFADCAARAERLRQAGAEIVLVAGVELTIMNRGFMPGEPGRNGCLACWVIRTAVSAWPR